MDEFTELPGIGVAGNLIDCSIGVKGDPECVTVTFSTVNGDTLLVLDPGYADLLSEWLSAQAKKARKPEPHLSLVESK